MLLFVYPNKCQTLWYETILHNKQNNKKISLISPLFQYLHYRPQFGCYQSKKDEVLLPKKTTEFLSEKQKLRRQEMFFYQQKKWKIEKQKL